METGPCCIRYWPRRWTRSRSTLRYARSLRHPFLAANDRFGVSLEIVREHAQRPRRAAHLLQRAVELLDLRGIRSGEIAGVVERAARAHQCAASAYQRQIKISDCLAHVVTDLLQGHLVNLTDDVLDLRLGRFELTRSGRKLHWLLRPVHRRRGRARKEIERYER